MVLSFFRGGNGAVTHQYRRWRRRHELARDFRDGVASAGDSGPGGRRHRRAVASPILPARPASQTCPARTDLPLEKEFVHQWLLGNGEYDHSAAAEDEHASLIAAGASQRLPATNKAGPVTADQAARWALGAIPALLPNAIQKLSVPRWTNMMAEQRRRLTTRSPHRRRWNGCCTRGSCR